MKRWIPLLALLLLPLLGGQTVKRGPGGQGAALVIQSPPDSGGPLTYNMTTCKGTVVSNRLRSFSTQINLCKAIAGMQVFIVWDNAAQNITIEPKDTEEIALPEVATSPGGGLILTAVGTVGSVVHLVSVRNGAWRVMSYKGSSALDNGVGGSNP